MIEKREEALEAALKHLRRDVEPGVGEELETTDVWEFPTCWAVGYNTRAYLETGSISHALAGGGPLIINRRTSRVRMGTWNIPLEHQLDEA